MFCFGFQAPVEVPHDTDPAQLRTLVNALLENEDESTPFSFFVEEREVVTELSRMTDELGIGAEAVVSIIYQPQAVFKVRAISQCSATIRGHADNIVELYFSPDGTKLASGSGDQTVRFWDIYTQTPKMTCKAHKHWVQCIAWSPGTWVFGVWCFDFWFWFWCFFFVFFVFFFGGGWGT